MHEITISTNDRPKLLSKVVDDNLAYGLLIIQFNCIILQILI